ncbi:pseudaminic acid cytidylyltransferase [Sulfitobacter sp. 1A16787]|uniref:pseudaminic acid cytidylyltransferase n=1 Tax=Sulfitobacter sp. 1A16787 TaxID=3368571 RepID=UPI00374659C4
MIPARGGSKRIPRKNIKPFGGRPMIAWSISAARESELFDRIIVSTDDDEIASVALREGAEVPFMRPAELADDYTGTIPVIAHAVGWQNDTGETAEEVCCIYATAPFIKTADLHRGLDILRRSGADFAFSVTSYAAPIQRALRIGCGGRVEMFDPRQFNMRSQDLEEAWHDAGQFYWGRGDAWLSDKPLFGTHAAAVPLPRYRVQDIDTQDDWQRADLIHKTCTLV